MIGWIWRVVEFGEELFSGGTASPQRSLPVPALTSLPPLMIQVIKEDQTNGEQVWAYTLEAQNTANGPNAPWQLVGNGTAIGNKRIHTLEGGPTSMTSIRVNATSIAPGFSTVSWAWFAAYAPCM